MEFAEARAAALSALNRPRSGGPMLPPPHEALILDHATRELDIGWVFFWDSREFVETGEPGTGLVGNSPILVDRQDGSVHMAANGQPVGNFLAEYKASRPPSWERKQITPG